MKPKCAWFEGKAVNH